MHGSELLILQLHIVQKIYLAWKVSSQQSSRQSSWEAEKQVAGKATEVKITGEGAEVGAE